MARTHNHRMGIKLVIAPLQAETNERVSRMIEFTLSWLYKATSQK